MSLNGLFLSFSAFCDLKITFFSKKNFKNNFFEKFFFPNFYNSCSLNIFEPKIWRRLGTFPSCFSSACTGVFCLGLRQEFRNKQLFGCLATKAILLFFTFSARVNPVVLSWFVFFSREFSPL